MAGIITGMRERWFSRRAVILHLVFLLFVPFCGLAAWWQVTRAEDGNGLSYLYSVEWPVFAIIGVYFWWMLIHTNYEAVGQKGLQNQGTSVASPGDDPPSEVSPIVAVDPVVRDDDPELTAYNERLAALATKGGKTWRNPEAPVARRHR